ncbi:MAG: hypothetical protein QOD00_2655 [Blastocatellia bacterium]|jgi:hypothetical protein|nr:hypothetical protein [Blastocatellia bacterium]
MRFFRLPASGFRLLFYSLPERKQAVPEWQK